MLYQSIFAAFLALFATVIGSFSGGGSSLILFPILLTFFNQSYISLLIISKLSASVMTFAASKVHFKTNKFEFRLMKYLLIGGVLGTALGTYFLLYHFDKVLFERLLGTLTIAVGFYIFFSKNAGLEHGKEKILSNKMLIMSAVFSFLINILNGLFGGTGLFLTIYLVSVVRMNFIRAIAYTMFNYAILSSAQVVYLVFMESFSWQLAVAVTIGALIGGSIGTKLQYLKGSLWVKRAAILMMLVIGMEMLLN